MGRGHETNLLAIAAVDTDLILPSLQYSTGFHPLGRLIEPESVRVAQPIQQVPADLSTHWSIASAKAGTPWT